VGLLLLLYYVFKVNYYPTNIRNNLSRSFQQSQPQQQQQVANNYQMIGHYMSVAASPSNTSNPNSSSSQRTNPQHSTQQQGSMSVDLNNSVEQTGTGQSFAGPVQSSPNTMMINSGNKKFS
jgi:hypothetical protein